MATLRPMVSGFTDVALDGVLEIVPAGGVAIEAGAHRGAATQVLAEHFDSVMAFEPHAEHFAYLLRRAPKANPHNFALMDRIDAWYLEAQPGAQHDGEYRLTGSKHAKPAAGSRKILSVTVDMARLQYLDFLMLDIQGAEYRALIGARETIARCRPFVLVNHSGLSDANYGEPAPAAGEILTEHGMRSVASWSTWKLWAW